MQDLWDSDAFVDPKRHLLSKPTLTEKLIDYAPTLDVHIIPDTVSNAAVYQLRAVSYTHLDVYKRQVR